MKISINVKPKSKEEKIEKIGELEFKVSVKEPPIGGRANWAVTRVLAEYFKVSPSRVKIISGATSRHKIIEIV